MSYCTNKKQATVTYQKTKTVKENFVTNDVPINISTDSSQANQGVCWAFYGQGSCHDEIQEFFACGNNPSIIYGFDACGHRTYIPCFNGVSIAPFPSFGFRAGTYSVRRVKNDNPTRENSIGNCANCLSGDESCTLTITNSQGKILHQATSNPCNYEVACDSECPPNHIRCKSNNYPGYCCIPCAAIASQINSMAARL